MLIKRISFRSWVKAVDLSVGQKCLLSCYPLIIDVKVRMISFWGKLLNFQNSKLSAKLLYVLRN